MRVLALVVAGLVLCGASLPAAAACPYKDQVAQSDVKKAPGAEGGAVSEQRRG